jgi:hypothetical protein
MHGQPNLKTCIVKQAKQIFQNKIKTKSYEKNAAIWYNKEELNFM